MFLKVLCRRFGDLPLGIVAEHGYRYRMPPPTAAVPAIAAAAIEKYTSLLERDLAEASTALGHSSRLHQTPAVRTGTGTAALPGPAAALNTSAVTSRKMTGLATQLNGQTEVR
jgi:hypothetical protein